MTANTMKKAPAAQRLAFVAAALAFTTSLFALTLAGPAPAAGSTKNTIIGTIKIGAPTGIPGNGPTGIAVDPVRGIVYIPFTSEPENPLG
jgi:hypothetical protein